MAAWPPLRKLLLSAAHLTGRGILKASAFALLVYCRPTGTAATQRVAVLRLGKEDAVFLQPCCLEGDVKLEVHRASTPPFSLMLQIGHWKAEQGMSIKE